MIAPASTAAPRECQRETTGIKDLFLLLHGVIRRHGQEAGTVRLNNKWVNVDPRDW